MKKTSPDSSASVTWSQDPVGPWQGFCAHYCFLRVHFCVYLVQGPNKLAVLSCLGIDGLFILLSWTHSWAWEAAAPGHTLEVLAQNLPLTEGLCGSKPWDWGCVGGFGDWVQVAPIPAPRPPPGLGRRWACFTAEALEGAIRDISGIRATRPTSRLPHLVTPLSSCGHLCHLEQWPEHLRFLRGAWTRESGSLEGAMWVPRTRWKVPESQTRGSEQLCRTWQAGGAADQGHPATWLCPCGRARACVPLLSSSGVPFLSAVSRSVCWTHS